MKISTGVPYDKLSKREFRENWLSGSHTLLEGNPYFPHLLANFDEIPYRSSPHDLISSQGFCKKSMQ
jgi:hypothetical protein